MRIQFLRVVYKIPRSSHHRAYVAKEQGFVNPEGIEWCGRLYPSFLRASAMPDLR